jgi:hypothetical protein
MNIFGAQPQRTSPVMQVWLGDAPDPDPAAGEEELEWMTSSTGSQKSWPTRSPLR